MCLLNYNKENKKHKSKKKISKYIYPERSMEKS